MNSDKEKQPITDQNKGARKKVFSGARKKERRKDDFQKSADLQSFDWWHPGRPKNDKLFHSTLMEFVKFSPELLAKLEQTMKPIASITIKKLHIVVTASTIPVEASWQETCERKLSAFFRDYKAQRLVIQNYDSSMLEDLHTLVKWDGKKALVVAGHHKDVAQKIYSLKQIETARPILQYMEIKGTHCCRLVDSFLQNTAIQNYVSIIWMSPQTLQITGSRHGVQKAKQMISDEIFQTVTERTPCRKWLFDCIKQEIDREKSHFPEIKIYLENDYLCFVGHPIEVRQAASNLDGVKENFDERKVSVPQRLRGLIIGTGGKNIKQLQMNYNVTVHIPPPILNDDFIYIWGQKLQTLTAEKEILAQVERTRKGNCVIDLQHFEKERITQDLIKEIHKHSGVKITWKNRNQLLLSGNKDNLARAKDLIHDEINAVTTKTLDVENYLMQFLQNSIEDASQKWPEVKIEIFDAVLKFTGHPVDIEPFSQQIAGKVQELRETITFKALSVRKEFHRNIIGKNAQFVRGLKAKHKVKVEIPGTNSDDCDIKIYGDKTGVAGAITAIQDLVQKLVSTMKKVVPIPQQLMRLKDNIIEDLKKSYPKVKIEISDGKFELTGNQDEVNDAFTELKKKIENTASGVKSIFVPLSTNQLLGVQKSEKFKELRKNFPMVNIKYQKHPPSLTVAGPTEKAEHAHIDVVKLLQKFTDFCVVEVDISSTYHGRIIGRQGTNIEWLKQLHPAVERIVFPRRDAVGENVFIIGTHEDVYKLFNLFACNYGATMVKDLTETTSNARRKSSVDSLHSMASSCDNDSSIAIIEEKAVFLSWKAAHQCLLSFANETPNILQMLKGIVGDNESLIVEETEILIAGQVSDGQEALWDYQYETKLNEIFAEFLYYETEIHPLSSMERNDVDENDLKVVWDEQQRNVLIYGKRDRVQNKIKEIEEIKARKKSVSFTYPCDGHILKFLRQEHKTEMGNRLKPEHLSLNVKDITVTEVISEVSSTEEWESEMGNDLKEYLNMYSCQCIQVPPLFAGEMRPQCTESETFVVCWEDSSLVIYGVANDVSKKADQLEKLLEKLKNKKKQVSVKVPCDNQYIFLCIKESVEFQEKLVHDLGEMGSPRLDDRAVMVHSEISQMSSQHEWEEKCRAKVNEFLLEFRAEKLSVTDEMAKSTANFVESRSSVVTKWLKEEKCLLICGMNKDVNVRVDLVKKKLEHIQTTVADVNDNTQSAGSSDGTLDNDTSVVLSHSSDAIFKYLFEPEIKRRFTGVVMLREDKGIQVTGPKSKVDKVKIFAASVVSKELVVKKYGAHKFLTDSTIGMQIQHIGIQHNCSVFVDKVKDEKWGNNNFILMPKDSEKASRFGRLDVKVEEGDITNQIVDVIVNTTNKRFSFDGQLSQAVFRKAGEYLRAIFSKIEDDIGFTPNGSLSCKEILHVAIPDKHESMENLVYKILKNSDQRQMASVALPTIGAGAGGWNHFDVAMEMKRGIAKFSEENPKNLKEIKIILFPSINSSDKKIFYDQFEPTKNDTEQQNGGFLAWIRSFKIGRWKPPTKQEPETIADDDNSDDPGDGNYAKISIVCNVAQDVEKAVEDVEKFVNLHLKEDLLENKAVLLFNQSHIEELKKLAKNRNVRIVVNREKENCAVTIQGMSEDVSIVKGSIVEIISSISTDCIHGWEPMGNKAVCRVSLAASSDEYQKVEKMFLDANKRWLYEKYAVVKIERVQNRFLYAQYQACKQIAHKRCSSSTIERKLFHGTDSNTVDKICQNGFDRSYAGKNATAYGRGVYFSTQSSYSNAYASPNGGQRQMFLAEVITGDYCRGNSSLNSAPENSSTKEPYDSVVDDMRNPTIFVVFRDWSVYGSYVITYAIV